MKVRTLVTSCHMRNCDRTAAVVCASCGHTYCAQHSGSLSIERRAKHRQTSGHWWMLDHVPTSTETYPLCRRCSKRPLGLLLR